MSDLAPQPPEMHGTPLDPAQVPDIANDSPGDMHSIKVNEQVAIRRPGTWAPGQTGNPHGRPKNAMSKEKLKSLLLKRGVRALRVLDVAMADPESQDPSQLKVAVQAARTVLGILEEKSGVVVNVGQTLEAWFNGLSDVSFAEASATNDRETKRKAGAQIPQSIAAPVEMTEAQRTEFEAFREKVAGWKVTVVDARPSVEASE